MLQTLYSNASPADCVRYVYSKLNELMKAVFFDGGKGELDNRKIDFGSGDLRDYFKDKDYVLFLLIQTKIKTTDILEEEYGASVKRYSQVYRPVNTWGDFARAVLVPVLQSEVSAALDGKVITEPERSAYINATLVNAKTGVFLYYQNLTIKPIDLANPENLVFFLENAIGEMR